jgi:hypothetical protein
VLEPVRVLLAGSMPVPAVLPKTLDVVVLSVALEP